eukprot:CAMPEP_0185612160 /NCGR_PEP_ID=MMETSP0436-20130131/20013_1 /TAXON_ID=626734 ORGANISM="Favella taraikaensis, Strain Fe Narragansett Bay" /NCGR_SAMPLE_ID=MMETSP0436 /ASSEMBLY_ACC=CAM_ASM_000390 /LENGTH=63 /DNA_ID=CAMNT_0028245343 /DNA_START=459 /DNA_END=650 /DNA_ORIENTATION=+
MMGYGAELGTMNGEYFEKITRKDSVFQRKVLELKSVCWMDPKAFVEHIPDSWARINVALYHLY